MIKLSLSINRWIYKNPLPALLVVLSIFYATYIYNTSPHKTFPYIILFLLVFDLLGWVCIDGILKMIFGIQKYVQHLDIEHIDKDETGYVTRIYTNYGFKIGNNQYVVICEKLPPSKEVKIWVYNIGLNGKKQLHTHYSVPMKRVTKAAVEVELLALLKR